MFIVLENQIALMHIDNRFSIFSLHNLLSNSLIDDISTFFYKANKSLLTYLLPINL